MDCPLSALRMRTCWDVNDGLVGLVDLIRQHFFDEEWWRATGQWPGPEVGRGHLKWPQCGRAEAS